MVECLIYKATFPDGRAYIGQTRKGLASRIRAHKTNSRYPYKSCAFYTAIKENGFNSIKWEKIEILESSEDLDQREIYWISFYKTTDRNYGFNLMYGGKNIKWHEESRKKLSEAKIGRPTHIDYKKLSALFKGRKGTPHTAETKLLMSEAQKGKSLSESHKLKISRGLGSSPIVVLDKNTLGLVGRFDSATECANKMNLNRSHICSILRGIPKHKSHKGYVFKRASDYGG